VTVSDMLRDRGIDFVFDPRGRVPLTPLTQAGLDGRTVNAEQ
jgi:hypothetical protein